MNRWNIPDWLERLVIDRDKACVYCGVVFSSSNKDRRNASSWEHIINDEKIITPENIALCCIACNASKGAKNLRLWLDSTYCRTNRISQHSVAPVIKAALNSSPRPERVVSGVRPDSRGTFFCFAKRKYPKKRRPSSPALRAPLILACRTGRGRTRYAQTTAPDYPSSTNRHSAVQKGPQPIGAQPCQRID